MPCVVLCAVCNNYYNILEKESCVLKSNGYCVLCAYYIIFTTELIILIYMIVHKIGYTV